MSKKTDEQVLQETEAIWSFLENLSLKNPEEYKLFINKVLKDGEENELGPPIADFVVETTKVSIVFVSCNKFIVGVH